MLSKLHQLLWKMALGRKELSDLGRQRQIVELLRDRPFASVRELQERLGVSAATVRRDRSEERRVGKECQ